MIDENRIRDVATGHTFEHKGKRYTVGVAKVTLLPVIRLPDAEPNAVEIDLVAGAIRLQLHLGENSASDDAYLRRLIEGGFRDIIDGKLPPGMRELI